MRHIIMFDFDGVLVDTERLAYELRTEFEPGLTLERFREHFTGNIFDVRPDRMPEPDDISHQNAIYSESLLKMSTNAGLEPLIAQLSETYELAIVSSSDSGAIRSYLVARGIAGAFSEVLGSDAGLKKSVKIAGLLESRGLCGPDAVFVTDTLGDLFEAKDAGVRTVAVTWGYHSEDLLSKGAPDRIARNAGELERAIDGLLYHSHEP